MVFPMTSKYLTLCLALSETLNHHPDLMVHASRDLNIKDSYLRGQRYVCKNKQSRDINPRIVPTILDSAGSTVLAALPHDSSASM
jgi:hypothetical protein